MKLRPETLRKGKTISGRQLLWAIQNYIDTLSEYREYPEDQWLRADMAHARDVLNAAVEEKTK